MSLQHDDPDLLDDVIAAAVAGDAVPRDLQVQAIALVTARYQTASDDLARARLRSQRRALEAARGR